MAGGHIRVERRLITCSEGGTESESTDCDSEEDLEEDT